MDEYIEEYELKNFSELETSFGKEYLLTNKPFAIAGVFDKLFEVTIYPDGDLSENEGYVSILFEVFDLPKEVFNMTLSKIQCTMSVVDVSGDSRFPQSFGLDLEESGEFTLSEALLGLSQIRLNRFIRRRVLLDFHEELLPEDTLTLRCEAVYYYGSILWKYDQYLEKERTERLMAVAEEESWFMDDKYKWLLDIRNPDSPLCSRLRKQSPFFEALFHAPFKEMEDGYMVVDRSDFNAFFSMLCYVRFGTFPNLRLTIDWCNLYCMANYYCFLELQVICSAYLKQHMTDDCAILVLEMADTLGDAELQAATFAYAASNWDNIRKFLNFQSEMSWEYPMWLKELLCVAKLLGLESETGDTLCDLAAKRILLSREELQESPTWSTFASEMPNLAKAILAFDGDHTLDSDEFRDHASSYDFYH